MTEEHKNKIGNANRGKKHSLETRKKIGFSNSKALLGIKKTEEHKRKIGQSLIGKKRVNFSGEKHPNWKGGITPLSFKIRNSLEYKLWRTAVYERDKYTCIWCGAKSGNGKRVKLNADHIQPFSLFPDLRFAIDNGRTLCEHCHQLTNTFGGRRMYRN